MYVKRYSNKKGEEKVELLLSLDEARRAVDQSPDNLLAELRRALDTPPQDDTYRPRGKPGRLEGLDILFDDDS